MGEASDRYEQAARLREQGASWRQVAEQLDYASVHAARSSFWQMARRRGVERTSLTQAEARFAYDLRQHGATWAGVGSLLDCSAHHAVGRIKYWARKSGWPWPVVVGWTLGGGQ